MTFAGAGLQQAKERPLEEIFAEAALLVNYSINEHTIN
jgi:hypothetical protein